MVVRLTQGLCWLGVLAALIVGCDTAADRTVEAEKPLAIESGHVAMVHVTGAMVIADKAAAGGIGNLNRDEGEVYTFSDANGYFKLDIPKGYGDYVLLTIGGTVLDSTGNPKAAFSMLAPKGSRNITPVTTLAALVPGLKSKIGADFDSDIDSAAGVNGNIMQLAKSAEAVLYLLTNKNNPIFTDTGSQIAAMEKIAVEFAKRDLTVKDNIIYGAQAALESILNDNTLVSSSEVRANAVGLVNLGVTCVSAVLNAIPSAGTVIESSILAATEQALASTITKMNGNMLAFDPTKSVIPIPNDLAWATVSVSDRKGLVTLDPTTAPDMATKALYTAINKLNLKGLSPNTPVGIPLTNSIAIDPASLKQNIKAVNVTKLFGVLFAALKLGDPTTTPPDQVKAGVITALSKLDANGWKAIQTALASYSAMLFKPITVTQDGNYIKVFPLGPFDANSTYLIYIQDKAADASDDFVDVNGIKVKPPMYYTLLKSDTELTGSMAALEDLRKNYAVLYNYVLKALGLGKNDTLEIFTFTTADKTLSLTDAAVISAAVKANDLNILANLTASGLPYAQIGAEYTQFDTAIKQQIKGSPAVTPAAFISFDITTLKAAAPTTTPVPYKIYNGNQYTDTLVIFQHGLGRNKDDAAFFANGAGFPIISMDLPLHGDRTVAGKSFFSQDMLSTRVNAYQAVFDMTLMLTAISKGQFDINGDQTPDIPEKIYFVGNSLGAMIGSVFSTFNSSGLDKIILMVGGANIGSVLDQATNAGITRVFSPVKNNTQYFVTLGILQLLIDPADPAYIATSGNKDKTLVVSAYKDTYVSNIATEILANVLGCPIRKNIYDFSSFNPADYIVPGWYMYGGSSVMTANWIKHDFLLRSDIKDYPEAADYLNQDYNTGAYHAARAQVSAFLTAD